MRVASNAFIMKAVLFSLLGLLVNLSCVPGSGIYPSIQWVPQNPIFAADGKVCSAGHRTIKVQLQSKVNFICPNTATVLQHTEVGVQTANMYENLWILYNKAVFDGCDTSVEGVNKTSRLLLQCNTPTKLTYFPVIFAQYTAEQNGLTFEGGRTYYFIGTSDGTESHINDTKGGHCNDTQHGIYMKIEVYVCKKSNQTYTDPECTSDDVGVLKCPPVPTPAPTTQQTSPAEQVTTTQVNEAGSTQHTAATSATITTEGNGVQGSGKPPGNLRRIGDNTFEQEKWKTISIVLIVVVCSIVVLVAIVGIMFCLKKNSYCYHVSCKKRVSHESLPRDKQPAERQLSYGGVSNHAYNNSIKSRSGGEDLKRISGFGSPLPSFYGVGNGGFVNDKPANSGDEMDNSNPALNNGNEPIQDGNIVFQNKDVYFEKGDTGKGGSPA